MYSLSVGRYTDASCRVRVPIECVTDAKCIGLFIIWFGAPVENWGRSDDLLVKGGGELD